MQNGDLGLGIDPNSLKSELVPEKLTGLRDLKSPTLNHEHQTSCPQGRVFGAKKFVGKSVRNLKTEVENTLHKSSK